MAIQNFDNTSVDVQSLKPFKKFIMSIGELPTNYIDSLSYTELLTWFCDYLQNKVIPVVDNHAEAIEELQNYFNNLDVQEEIDNKLDEMAEDGTLEEIITSYLETKALLCFDTIADLKNATNIVKGSYVKTLGYHSTNDGGGAIYKINDNGAANEMTIIACQNNLKAVMIPNYKAIYPEQFGAYGDGEHDDTSVIQFIINNYNIVHFYGKTYLIKGVYVPSNKTLKGDGYLTKFIGDGTTHGLLLFKNDNTNLTNIYIENIELRNFDVGIYSINTTHVIMRNVTSRNSNYGAIFAGITYINRFYDCQFTFNTYDGFQCGLEVIHPTLNAIVTPVIATFDFFSCGFAQNGAYGINGGMRVFNFYGGYSENNTLGAVRAFSTSDRRSQELNFNGFDIEEEYLGYIFESNASNCYAEFINIEGGQIALKAQTNNELRACVYLKSNTACQLAYVHDIHINCRRVPSKPEENTYDIYADVSGTTKNCSADISFGNENNSDFITNLTYIIPTKFFVSKTQISNDYCSEYWNRTTENIDLTGQALMKIVLPDLIFVKSVTITTSDSATFSVRAFGMKTNSFSRTASQTVSTTDNVAVATLNAVGNTIAIRNTSSADKTITKIEIDGYWKK